MIGPKNMDMLGKVVRMMGDEDPERRGFVVSLQTDPCYMIEWIDGQRSAWRVSSCVEATAEEAADYWWRRARRAENELLKIKGEQR